jgi:site-specific recombinase XerD
LLPAESRAFIYMVTSCGRRCPMRLSTAIQRFDTQLRADGKSEHTRGAHMRDLREFSAWSGSSTDVAGITPDTVARYLAGGPKGKPAVSLNRTKTALRMFFRFLTDAGYLEADPARLIRNGRCQPKTPEYLKPAQTRRLLAAIPANDGPVARRDRIMFSLLLQTGIQLGSLVGLKVSDVDIGWRTMTIIAKGGTEETVYLKSSLRKYLRSYFREMDLRFKHWLEKSGIKRHLTVHSLRHTFAMNLYRQTGDLRLVQTALGHKHIGTTEIYARVEDKALRRALEKL